MKSFISILLAVILAFSLCACAAGNGVKTTTAADDSQTTTDGTEPATDEGIINGDNLFALGSVDGSNYENSFLGYGIKLDGWYFYSKEEIAKLNNWSESMMDEDTAEAIKKSLEAYPTFADMLASSPVSGQNVSIQYQNAKEMYGKLLNENNLGSVLEAALPQIRTTYSGMGYEIGELKTVTVELDGDSFKGIYLDCEYVGTHFVQKQAAVLRGDYLIFVAVTGGSEAEVDEVFSQFYKLEA